MIASEDFLSKDPLQTRSAPDTTEEVRRKVSVYLKFQSALEEFQLKASNHWSESYRRALNTLTVTQNQSPDSPILYFHNLNYLKKEEILLVFLLLMKTENEDLFSSTVLDLEDLVERNPGNILMEDEQILLLRLLFERKEDRKFGKAGFRYRRLQKFLAFFHPRALIGLLKDQKYINFFLKRRLTCKTLTPSRARRGQRIRGYRDHGLLTDESTRARRAAHRLWSDDFQEGSALTPFEVSEFRDRHWKFKKDWALRQSWSEIFGCNSKFAKRIYRE